MYLHAQSGYRGKLYDLDTGQEIKCPIWANTDTGMFEAYQVNEQGKIKRDINGDYLTYKGKARLHFVPREEKKAVPILKLGAHQCILCKSPLTLPGEELCPFCKDKDKGRKKFSVKRLSNPLLDCPCQTCHNLAEWQVSDEVEVSPVRQGKFLFDRGAVVGQRFYCSKCYSGPRLLDEKGEVIKVFEDAGGVRPQWHST